MKTDPYEILGVSKNATDKEIKSAYRKLALQWHPDRNKSAQASEKFKEINEAYEILSDPKKKQMYDQYGHSAFAQGSGQGMDANPFGGSQQGPFNFTYTYGNGQNPFEGFGFSDPFEIFEQFFGMSSPFGQYRRQPHGQITIDFEEAFRGLEKEVVVEGKKRKVKIPAGIDDGQRIRFSDYSVTVRVRPDKTFQRQGDDLIVDVQVPLFEAVAGGEINTPTPEGETTIRIKPGTQPGAVLRLSGRGMPRINSRSRGDLYIRLHIDIPRYSDLTSKQKKALEELKKS
ncbi:MAG: DnaJ domain-containing protein [Candidatus Blackburnbacteria bacterium]|nr:DnaJ domain-containing protein [Candidatus Blackburnbacteria bacterium]